jgi:hypothetical protein
VSYSLNCCTKIKILWVEIGAKRPNYGQNRTVRWHRPCTVGTALFKQIVLAPSCTVQIRYGPSRRSKKPKDGVVAQACIHTVIYGVYIQCTYTRYFWQGSPHTYMYICTPLCIYKRCTYTVFLARKSPYIRSYTVCI